MKYRDFGNTGIKVSEIGFGSWAIGGNEHGNSYGATDDKVSTEAILQAIEEGCNFFDTADVYGWGHSEEILGKALKNRREHAIIATKVGGDFYQGNGFQTFTPEYIRFAFEKSLARLRTDYIDVYQLHNPPIKLISDPSTYETLKALKKEGKIRAWGVSVFDATEALSALRAGQPDSLQVSYNIFNTKPAEHFFPAAYEKGCAIIAREALANGFLSGKYEQGMKFESGDMRYNWPQDYKLARVIAAGKLKFLAERKTLAQAAIQYVLANQNISVAVTGVKSTEQVKENFAASELPPIDDEEMAKISELQSRQFKN